MRFIFTGIYGFIMDYSWYYDRELEIDTWCLDAFGYQPREGMALTFRQESDKMWFMLRWNND